ncbi:MAG TPA: SRPBCC domain-containing protein [Symbiobacteriaceae bacterium]|nr:SRPBCC domain-containing protein [Symbiobacteriaceae bacterium]
MTDNASIKVSVSRTFAARPEQVFDAWLDQSTAGRWLFATPTGQMVRVEIDARVGGRFTIVDRRDGEDVEHTGEFLELDRPRRLVFTCAVPKYSQDIDRVTVAISPLETGCGVTLTHEMDAKWAEWAAGTAEGWTDILAGLAETLK